MKNLIVAQSGGPTAAINATLSGVIKQSALCSNIGKVFGAKNGIKGLLNENIVELNSIFDSTEKYMLLEQTPAAALGSCRYKLPDIKDDKEVYEKISQIFKSYDIGYFLYIGGNDSMDTVDKLSKYFSSINSDVKVMGVPKTIDNDLFGTDHTPGFGSAAKYIATTMSEIKRDCEVYDFHAVTIVEIMGRNAGWLTASSALADLNGNGPQLIYLPEVPFSIDKFINDIQEKFENHNSVVIAISEGIKDKDGKYIADYNSISTADVFGNAMLSGASKVLEQIVKEKLKCKVRSIELNLPQRCAGHILSATDIDESVTLGSFAVNQAVFGKTGEMAAVVRKNSAKYSIEYTTFPISDIANKEKLIPVQWIDYNKSYIKQELFEYLLPLIQGEKNILFKNGLPVHLTI